MAIHDKVSVDVTQKCGYLKSLTAIKINFVLWFFCYPPKLRTNLPRGLQLNVDHCELGCCKGFVVCIAWPSCFPCSIVVSNISNSVYTTTATRHLSHLHFGGANAPLSPSPLPLFLCVVLKVHVFLNCYWSLFNWGPTIGDAAPVLLDFWYFDPKQFALPLVFGKCFNENQVGGFKRVHIPMWVLEGVNQRTLWVL